MRGDKLKRHMMTHENGRMEDMKKVEEKEVETLEKEMKIVYAESKRKIELGRKMAYIAEKNDMNTFLLPKDMQEAIDLYEKFGQNIEKKDIQWKGWQQKLCGYLNEKCDRKIFWVVGREGGEGKTFFQKNIQLEFGYERVIVMPLTENERNTFHV